jgi:hypothetical protein
MTQQLVEARVNLRMRRGGFLYPRNHLIETTIEQQRVSKLPRR